MVTRVFTIVQIHSIYMASVNQDLNMNSIILYNASDFRRKHRSKGRFPDLAQLPFSKRSISVCISIEQRRIYDGESHENLKYYH